MWMIHGVQQVREQDQGLRRPSGNGRQVGYAGLCASVSCFTILAPLSSSTRGPRGSSEHLGKHTHRFFLLHLTHQHEGEIFSSVYVQNILQKPNPQSSNSVPTTSEYTKDGGKQVLRVLESAAGWIPIPCIQGVIRVALKIIEICEEASEIEERLLQLRDRVCGLMMAILDHVTENPDPDAILTAGKGIEEDMNILLRTLHGIVDDLDKIKEQRRWLLVFFKDANKAKVDECMDKLTTSLERFNLSNGMYTADSLKKIEDRLGVIQSLAEQASKQLGHLVEKVDGIATVMNALNEAKAQKATLFFDRQHMPLKPRIFHGRDDLLEDVANLLIIENTSRVCILGPGGMGKTSLALAVVETSTIQSKFMKRNRYWIPCIEAVSANLFLQIMYTNLQITRDTKDPLEDILYELSASDEPRLILLDNFETPCNTLNHTQSEVNSILCRLAQLKHVALLVTMRGAHPPNEDIVWQTRKIPPTDAEACRQIYHEINPSSKGDPDVDRLLQTIGYMPFAVTLMATLGKEGESSAKMLLDEWARSGTDMLSDLTNEKSMNRSISLSIDSPLMKHNFDALTLLATLSMLPAGTTRRRLNDWAPSIKSLPLAIATLSKAGLLMVTDGATRDSSTIFVLPVVQSYMQLQKRISNEIEQSVCQACCSYLSAHRSRAGDPGFKADAEALGAEATNIQSIFQQIFSSTEHSTTESLDSFLVFNWYLHDTKPNISLATQALEVSRRAGNQKFIAESLFCLGSTCFRLGQFAYSEAHLEEACNLFRKLSKSEPESKSACLSSAGRCGLALALCMQFLSDPSSAIFRVLKVAEDDFRVAGNIYDEALRLVQLGQTYIYQGNYSHALICLEKGRSQLEKLDRPADLARCLYEISDTHYRIQDYLKALEVCEQALKIIEELGHESDYLYGDMTQKLSGILTRLGRTTEALEYAKISLVNHEITARPLGVAQMWERTGSIYLLQSNLEDAHAAYQAAFDIWSSSGSIKMAVTGRALCSTNMEGIRLKQQDPTADVALHGTDIDKSIELPLVHL